MFFWFSCLAAGFSLCLLVWLFTRPVVSHSDNGRLDSLPRPLRLIWPWVLALSLVCRPFISWSTRQILVQRMQVAGLDTTCLPEHIIAMQVLAGGVAGSLAAWLLATSMGLTILKALLLALLVGCAAAAWPRYGLHSLARRRQAGMLRELPFLLDMTTLCVEAGLNLQGALQQAAQHGPPGPLRDELGKALTDIRAGMPRSQALEELAGRTGLAAIRSLVLTLAQADQLGMSLGPLLRAQSEQRRSERFLRAEKLALEAPVKMLFPMVFCIFPCTFLIIGFPIAVKLLRSSF